jgi:hypothetical protein
VIIGGVTTTNVMDTLAGSNGTEVSSDKRVVARWFLYPAVPAGLEINGSAEFSFWLRGTGSMNPATLTVYVFSYDQNGVRTPVFQGAQPGNINPNPAYTRQAYAFTLPATTVVPNGTLEIQMDLNGASATKYFVGWGNSTLDSGFTVTLEKHIEVGSVATLDHLRRPRVSFYPNAANKTLYVDATVTDPLGGYDIRWTNVTVRDPSGAEVVANVSMAKTSGFPNSFASGFEFVWNYSGAPPGVYNSTVYAVDQNGHRAWLANSSDRTYGGHIVWLNFSFTIGSFPHYVNFRVVDAYNATLPGALLVATVAGAEANRNLTDTNGIANITLFAGTYAMVAVWQGVNVSAQPVTVTGDVGVGNAIRIDAAVFSPAVSVVDSQRLGLHRASVFVTHPNGSTTTVPYRTNSSGTFVISRTAAGAYRFRVSWLGVEVADVTAAINSTAPVAIAARAYHLSVRVIDSAAAPLGGASAVARNSSTGTVMDSRLTDQSGLAEIVLPQGTYDLDVLWAGTLVSGHKSYYLGADGTVTVVASVYYLAVSAKDPHGAPLGNASVVVTSEETGEPLGVAVTGAAGDAVARVPTIDVRVQLRWLDVLVADARNVPIAGNRTLDLVGMVYYLKLRPVDSRGLPVDALVTASNASTSRLYAAGQVVAAEVELRLPAGPSRLRAQWLTALIYDAVHAVAADATETLKAAVFYQEIRVADSRGKGVEGSQLLAAQVLGEVRAQAIADEGGNATLRLPAVNYTLSAAWKGVKVYEAPLAVSGDASATLDSRVYYIDVTTKDSTGAALSPVFLRASSAGEVRDTGYTADGKRSLRLPGGSYEVLARFAASYYLTDVSWEEKKSIDLQKDEAMEFTVSKFPVPFYLTIAFWAILLAIILLLLIVLLFSRLRGAPPLFLKFLDRRAAPAAAKEGVEGSETDDAEETLSPPDKGEAASVRPEDVERDEQQDSPVAADKPADAGKEAEDKEAGP